jgi:phage terminase large subunit
MAVTEYRYRPIGGNADLFACRDRVVVHDGPKGSGRTRAQLEKAFLAAEKYPGARIALVRHYRSWLTQSVLVELESQVIPMGHPCIKGAHRKNRNSYQFPNGSEIVCLGFNNPQQVNSAQYDMAIVAEATDCDPAAVQELYQRLRNGVMPYQQLILDCNPKGPRHWIADWFMRGRWDERTQSRVPVARVPTTHKDNPRWWNPDTQTWTPEGDAYVVGVLGSLEGIDRRRNLLGEWCQGEGLVYESFRHDTNVTTRPWDDRDTRGVLIACDDGVADPFAALRIEWDHDKRVHVSAMRYGRGMSSDEKMLAVEELGGVRSNVIVYDSAAGSLGEDLRRLFPFVVPSDKTTYRIEEGCKLVRKRMQVAADGRPRLTVDPGCESLLTELDAYAWSKRSDGTDRDLPEDRNNHALDALRYAVVYLDNATEPNLI